VSGVIDFFDGTFPVIIYRLDEKIIEHGVESSNAFAVSL